MTTTTIRYLTGDATDPAGHRPACIAHVCNDADRWGRGFVRAVSGRWPQPERAYRDWYRHRVTPFELGAIQIVEVAEGLSVVNMIGQHGIASSAENDGPPPIRYDAVARCLSALGTHAQATGASVHLPRIGCGLAGGRWERIEPLIRTHLCLRAIAVTVYDLP